MYLRYRTQKAQKKKKSVQYAEWKNIVHLDQTERLLYLTIKLKLKVMIK